MDAKSQILFLCTGNYYRSRYAEELFNFRAKSEGLGWSAFSRGLAEKGSPENVGAMSRFALEALSARNIEPAGARRLPVSCSVADFGAAELVIALKGREHRPFVERRFPDLLPRVIFWDVDDVAFAPPVVALAQIDDLIDGLISGLRKT
ncbi:low molecular weight phosphatase family protein [Bradyrhizobium sp. CB3481]|uniref:arsenate-mycothiol transferase ArsC n=1 Tax=Bradyrhizobium sp. CB3481 TaxID=3039158 RepID=UPI0024B16772|nr:low molecular weight phosphatase family protein [Bradyrhizobium sp. CB3481]WFU18930.1 low molecular weight phosphatase family protein [Bradyrhizobium sp. CB3481]